MNSTARISRVKQRAELRNQLLKQRQVIASQIADPLVINHGYPRSMTMRFLTHQPVPGLLLQCATLLLGARFLKTATFALGLSRVMRPVIIRK